MRPPAFLLPLILAASASAASLQVLPSSVQFGERAQQKILRSEVLLKNTDARTVSIVGVQTDCGCTVGTIRRKTLGPGEQTEVDISFETRDYRGPVRRNVTLTLDNGDTLVIPVTAIVNPYGDWAVSESILNFGTVAAGAEKEVVFQVTPNKTYRLTAATPSVGWLQARFVPVPDSPRYRVWLKRLANTPAGSYQGSVFLDTTDPEMKTLEVPFVITVKGDITVIPNPVTMGTTRVGQRRTVIVSIDDWKWSDIPTLVLPRGTVTFTQQDGSRYQFDVSLTPDRVGLVESNLYVLRPRQTPDESVEQRTVQTVPVVIRVLPDLQ